MPFFFYTFVRGNHHFMNHLRTVWDYIFYFFSARHTRGFSVHSPFVFQFTRFVLGEKHAFYAFQPIEDQRIRLKNDSRILNITDFGTGNDRSESVSNIALHALKQAKYGQLLYRMVHYFKSQTVLELGTSLGVTTSYLASSSKEIQCLTLEGCPRIAEIARENFNRLGLKNVEVIVGNIDQTLTDVINKTIKLDFVFVDANHQSKAVLNYFELCLSKIHADSVMVIDDIYWSDDMKWAWQQIKNHSRVTSTIDLFQIGIVFFNKDLHKMHYKMRY